MHKAEFQKLKTIKRITEYQDADLCNILFTHIFACFKGTLEDVRLDDFQKLDGTSSQINTDIRP